MKKKLQKSFSSIVVMVLLFAASINAQINPTLAGQLRQALNNRVQNYGNKGVWACVIMPNGNTWFGIFDGMYTTIKNL